MLPNRHQRVCVFVCVAHAAILSLSLHTHLFSCACICCFAVAWYTEREKDPGADSSWGNSHLPKASASFLVCSVETHPKKVTQPEEGGIFMLLLLLLLVCVVIVGAVVGSRML